jgi:hypothetical protein
MKKLTLLVVLALSGCGGSGGSSPPPPTSLLSGENVYFINGNLGSTFTATLNLYTNNSFAFSESYPSVCFYNGTWSDSNPGSTSGQLTLIVGSYGCSKSIGQVLTFPYTLTNGVLIL